MHIDIKKLGRIPDGGGWRKLGRRSGTGTTRSRTAATRSCTTPSTTTPGLRFRRTTPTSGRTTPTDPNHRAEKGTETDDALPRPRCSKASPLGITAVVAGVRSRHASNPLRTASACVIIGGIAAVFAVVQTFRLISLLGLLEFGS